MASWIIGIFMTFVAIIGLFMASYGVDSTFSWIGILFFVFATGFIFKQITRNTG